MSEETPGRPSTTHQKEGLGKEGREPPDYKVLPQSLFLSLKQPYEASICINQSSINTSGAST